MSASDISDSLVTNLGAASVFGSNQVATHFQILEQTSACCAVVGFVGLVDSPDRFGNARETVYTHFIKLYVKDTSGNAQTIQTQLQGMVDKAACSLRVDRTLQGDADIREVNEFSFTHDVETAFEAGGATWFLADGLITTTEWP